eukprot:m.124953 g.124953  ORF g.124953 m.124953 type:complete len:150 (+) comp13789_c0_seq2:846-1295(+)
MTCIRHSRNACTTERNVCRVNFARVSSDCEPCDAQQCAACFTTVITIITTIQSVQCPNIHCTANHTVLIFLVIIMVLVDVQHKGEWLTASELWELATEENMCSEVVALITRTALVRVCSSDALPRGVSCELPEEVKLPNDVDPCAPVHA